MARKDLADWIKTTESRGYSEADTKVFLMKKGYSKKDIDEAVESLKPKKEAGTKKGASSKKEDKQNLFWEIFKPSVSKIALILILLAILLFSTYSNLTYLPETGDYFCHESESNEKTSSMSDSLFLSISKNNADPDDIINQLNLFEQKVGTIVNERKESRSSYSSNLYKLFLGNLYFVPSGIYLIDPFFPMPCEYYLENIYRVKPFSCKYYISKDNFDCFLKDESYYINSNAPMVPYQQVSLISIAFNTFLMLVISYILLSLLAFSNKRLLNLKWWKKLIISFAVITILYLMAIFISEAFIFLMIVSFFYIIFLFIKNQSARKIISFALIFLLIFAMVAGIMLLKYFIITGVEIRDESYSVILDEKEFVSVSCNNTKLLTLDEIKSFGISYEAYLNEEWKVCWDPGCSDICQSHCPTHAATFYLRGDNPSCICGCRNPEQ